LNISIDSHNNSRGKSITHIGGWRVGSQNRLINTSPTRAQLPFRIDCIANKTQVVSAREKQSKEVKVKERGRQEESEGEKDSRKRGSSSVNERIGRTEEGGGGDSRGETE